MEDFKGWCWNRSHVRSFTPSPSGEGEWRRWVALQDCRVNVCFVEFIKIGKKHVVNVLFVWKMTKMAFFLLKVVDP